MSTKSGMWNYCVETIDGKYSINYLCVKHRCCQNIDFSYQCFVDIDIKFDGGKHRC